MSLTSFLFRAARASADARSISKGPEAIAKRAVRKRVYRGSARTTRRILKGFGL